MHCHPGEGRDPPFSRQVVGALHYRLGRGEVAKTCGTMGPGVRRDDNLLSAVLGVVAVEDGLPGAQLGFAERVERRFHGAEKAVQIAVVGLDEQ